MKRIVPKFETEAEEARWWDEHLDEIEDDVTDALNTGSAKLLTRERLMKRIQATTSGQVIIQLPEADIKRAHDLAGERGLDDRTYIKTLLHEALEREGGKAS